MSRAHRIGGHRGMSLAEVLVAVVVFALVATAIGFMFEETVKHFAFTSTSLTSEQEARVAITRVTNAMRQASIVVTASPDAFGNTPAPIAVPSSTASPSNQVVFYQVASLNSADFGQDAAGEPTPCYNKVTITWTPPDPSPSPPQYGADLTEVVTPYATPCPNFPASAYSQQQVIAHDVTGFTVTENGGSGLNPQTGDYQVDVQITKQLRVDQSPRPYQLTATVHPVEAGGN